MKISSLLVGILFLRPLTCWGFGGDDQDDFRTPDEIDTPHIAKRYPSSSPSVSPSMSPTYSPTLDPCKVDLEGNNRDVTGDNYVEVEYNYELTMNNTDASDSYMDSFVKEMELNITTFILEELYPICKSRGVVVSNRRSLRGQNSIYRKLSEHGGDLEGISTLKSDEIIRGKQDI